VILTLSLSFSTIYSLSQLSFSLLSLYFLSALYALSSLGINKLLQHAEPVILEPVMRVEVVVAERYQSLVVGDLTKRDGRVADLKHLPNGVDLSLCGRVPLRTMLGYSTQLRSLSQGTAHFNMEFDEYAEASASSTQAVLKMIRGF
jgi:elongation factor G